MKAPVLHLPVLVVTPHNSGHAPLDILAQMLGAAAFDRTTREAKLEHLLHAAEPFTDVIFHSARARMWHAGISPFVVDVAEDRDDDALNGAPGGVIPYADTLLRPLYPHGFHLTTEEREDRLRRYWDPFHEEIERTIARHKVRMIVTGHAMHTLGPIGSHDEGRRRPALTLVTGGDAFGDKRTGRPVTVDASTARALHGLLELHFGSLVAATRDVPREVALNVPIAGDPLAVRYATRPRPVPVPAFGILLNRALFLRGDQPDDVRVRALNAAFEAFLRDATRVVLDQDVA
ncbi:N-formylglutamate amidohydrolase [Deinococcus yavapaiensis]|uniref:N-formylglutamate amidohydrolase n=1 Tax=Deinococcus yavapaiensis KR-236 TaxID=694435 RepID=A0A318S7L3_9DEIO|nr:N-formylglutamate amidohydrolase [Deinococcus yavapaiensis]PYE53036.1 N-formylglutamate amidohydrolase [Deinococcus yavapaiensis KR-236]